MTPLRILFAILATGILFPATASAHMLWINASDFSPEAGQEVHIRIGWGHEYPRDQMINPDMIRDVKVLSPKGDQVEAERVANHLGQGFICEGTIIELKGGACRVKCRLIGL